uniref:Uncharacterized protein n=1 Tax=viral metagenome TaxID=1070528 RepID=A0A6C0I834_9ZZZZ
MIKKPSKLITEITPVTVPLPSVRNPCNKRSTAKFMRMVSMDPCKLTIPLARALKNEDLLDLFDDQKTASECIFSYPDSDWYGVYLLDQSGNKYFNEDGVKIYFKIDASAKVIQDTVTYTTPSELLVNGVEIDHCTLSGSACTGTRKVPDKTLKPRSSTQSAGPIRVSEPSPISEIIPGLETLVIGGPTTGRKTQITRDYFEQMKSKEVIVDWMINNMERGDLLKCIQSNSQSPQELAQVPESIVETTVLQTAEELPESEFNKILKKVTKESIAEKIKSIKNKDLQKQEIVSLCTRSGLSGYYTKTNKKGELKVFDSDDEQLDEADIPGLLDKCSIQEALRMKLVIEKMRKRYIRSKVRSAISKMKTSSKPVSSKPTVEDIMLITDETARKNKIVEICTLSGKNVTAKLNKKGILKIFDEDGEQVDEGDVIDLLKECISKLKFGRKRR